ncbi:MAG: DNA recombination protein RmuC [Bacteroidales bacterium]
METILLIIILLLLIVVIGLQIAFRSGKTEDKSEKLLAEIVKNSARIEAAVKDEIKSNRLEQNNILTTFQQSFLATLSGISKDQAEQLKGLIDSSQQSLTNLTKAINEQMTGLTGKTEENNKINREELTKNLKEFSDRMNLQLDKISTKVEEKLGEMNTGNQKKLDEMRQTVDEKLQKTLNERLGQSFEVVSRQLENVQKGLGEMQTLAQDVGGLKKVLSNVKMRGGLGEVRLEMLLEQILAPEQYEANVKTKKGSSEVVEFALKMPGKEDDGSVVYLPIDAKFPQEDYIQLTEAYEVANLEAIDAASKKLEITIKKMAKDIKDKYIDPPNTTEFGIMFLPFEGVYAEVVRRASLMETLQRDFRIIVTGPTTLAAILNSLQMGFKTLAIQKRSSEVWRILGAVKTEFGKFGGLLDKAQKNLHTATSQLDDLVGTRTKAIQRSLKNVDSLPAGEAAVYLPEMTDPEVGEEESPPSRG